MTQRLYRIALLLTALVWLQTGMRLSHVATTMDTGNRPALSELMVLAMLAVWGTFGVIVLWRHPPVDRWVESDAPEQPG